MNLFKSKKESFMIPIHGTLQPLHNVPDAVFNQKLLGDGFAIEPFEPITKVIAPVSGILTVCFPSKHAYGISTKDGIEILLHLGIDTVELNGEGFTCHVTQGQKIKQGDLLCTMDLSVLKEKGKATICPIIVTSGEAITIHKSNCLVSLHQTDAVTIS